MSIDPSAIAGYRLGETLSQDERFVLVRAQRLRDGAGRIIRWAIEQPPAGAAAAALVREFEIGRSVPLDCIARPLEWVGPAQPATDVGGGGLAFADHGAQTLATIVAGGRLQLGWVLDYALQLVAGLGELHRLGILHRSLRPAAVLIEGDAGRVRLADLTDAARDAAEAATPLAPELYRTRLPYAAPEQTGRIDRTCDYRSDFYSLGALLYELLTGRVPFVCTDPLELIHAHVARRPQPLTELVPSVPLPVAQIVMKLLEKSPDARYQSTAALERDLRRCQREWAQRGRVHEFAIGERDVPERFTVPQRLYGREPEIAALNAAFEAACGGAGRLTLIAGQAGVGKTALISALRETVVRGNGYYVSGKFDQLSLDVPYSALVQALRHLVEQLLAETAVHLERHRQRLSERLGAGASVIAALVPELKGVLGEQPAPTTLPPGEARNRFTLAFQNLIAALATDTQPLVIFLDDLQWADAATLQLLTALLADADAHHLLVVGSYRDPEVAPDHPLQVMLASVLRAGVPVQRLMLQPLQLPALAQLTADTLHVEPDEARRLAELLLAKTDGNPFFVTQFLLALYRDGWITFDAERSRWTCAPEAIAAAAMTDNVAELMSRKIARLAPATQRVLTLAACIGNRFDLDTLCAVSGQSVDAVSSDLADAALEGLIVPKAWREFEFLHDRVQQAAYACLAECERPQAHLRVGRVLRDRWERQPGEVALFDMASHLNLGAALISARDERLQLARIDLFAGRRAKQSSAHAAALGFFETATSLLVERDWRSDDALAFELHLEAAQAMYLCGRFDEASAAIEALLPRARKLLDRARVHVLRMVQFENRGRYDEAQASARSALALLGVELPQTPAAKEAVLAREIESIERQLAGRPIASLVDLPPMADPNMRMVMEILTDLWSTAYILGDGVLARLISATLVRLSLQHGQTEESAYGYVTHAITVGPVQGRYADAFEYGTLALAVNERFNDHRRRAKIYQQFHAHVNPWCRPMHTCIAYAREACRSGLESGDFLYAAYGASTQSWPAFIASQNLATFVQELTPNLALVNRLRNAPFADALRLMLAWARALQGESAAPLSLSCDDGESVGSGFDEAQYRATYGGNAFFTMFHAIARLHLAFMLEEFDAAHAAARSVRATVHQLIGMTWGVLFDFWNGLTLAARLEQAADAAERAAWLGEIETAQRSMATLAAASAENYACQAALLEAELHRLNGRFAEAVAAYEAALAAADGSAHVQQQAIASELFARFWLRRGNDAIAGLYLRRALNHYADWGARAKVRVLQERHAALLKSGEAALPRASDERAAGAVAARLDLAAIVKAAHAIGEPLPIDALIERLLTIAIEHAGARRGVLLEDFDGELRVSATGSADGGVATLFDHAEPVDPGVHCSPAVVQYMQRTRMPVVVGDATQDERFARDGWITAQRPQSILCLPIAHQGQLGAILYLEHDLMRDAFGPQRVEVLQLLLTQAAVSLHNARLAQRVQQALDERERAEQTLSAIEAGTGAVTGEDFFRALVRNLAQALRVRWAFVAECFKSDAGVRSARVRALWVGDGFGPTPTEYALAGTPCEAVLDGAVCHHPTDVHVLFPVDTALADMGARSYLGMPLVGSGTEVIGHVALIDDRPMPDAAMATTVLRLSAGRAGAELERQQALDRLRKALVELEGLRDRLQEENVYLRRELIANVSHDLRSPLASLRGYLETLTLKEQTLSVEKRREYLAIASRQAEHLQALIAELFDLARLDFRSYRINSEPVHLGELARDVLQKFRLRADQAEVSLDAVAADDLPFVRADIALVERALSNLIDNALKHTPAGGLVELALSREGSERVLVSVRDTGRGIAAADLPRVFERFYRADKARSRDAGGSGLGLAIVKRIVELHGAEVRVESQDGVGTRFWFALPVAEVAAVDADAAVAVDR